MAWAGLAAALAWAAPAASAQNREQPQLSEGVSTMLQKVPALEKAKNYPAILQLVDAELPKVKPDSYDAAFLLDVEARILITENKLAEAIVPWREALKISEAHNYFPEAKQNEITKYLAQLVFSQATNTKDKDVQARLIREAASYLKAYIAKVKQPEPETLMLYSQILFYEATTPDSAHPNMALLKQARDVVAQGLESTVKPKESFYLVLLAIQQSENDTVHSAQTMEFILAHDPKKKDLWTALFGTYVNLAAAAKEGSDEQRKYYVRAINTMERAQKYGFMTTPRDNYNLVTLYINAGQYSKATALLYTGMKTGKIESTLNNWRILGAYYQQANKDFLAIDSLAEAAKLFPKEGSLDLQIGQIYQGMDKTREAHAAYLAAVRKGNTGDRPHLAWLYLAYTTFELGDYKAALAQINHAQSLPDGAKDPQVANLKKGIEEMIRQQAQEAAQAKASAKRTF